MSSNHRKRYSTLKYTLLEKILYLSTHRERNTPEYFNVPSLKQGHSPTEPQYKNCNQETTPFIVCQLSHCHTLYQKSPIQNHLSYLVVMSLHSPIWNRSSDFFPLDFHALDILKIIDQLFCRLFLRLSLSDIS